MPELDAFEARLATAVHALADRADTRVDAGVVARETVGRRPFWSIAWSWLRVPLPAAILLVLALLLGLVAGLALVGGLLDRPSLLAPLPSPTAEPTAEPTASAGPTDDGTGIASVTGSGTFSIVSPGTTSQVGDGKQIRGFVATGAVVMDDPRVTGTGTLQVSLDTRDRVGTEWGTYRLETADGAWEGTLAGGSWNDGNASDLTGYLVGSGEFDGYSFYVDIRSSGFAMELEGIIFPGPRPGP